MVKSMSYQRVVAFIADRNGEAQQSIPTGTPTTFEATQVASDIGGYYNNSTFIWTPQAGIYIAHAKIKIIDLDSNDELMVTITKDSNPIYFDNRFSTANNQAPSASAFGLVFANGSNQFSVLIEHNQGANLDISSDPIESYFYGYRIG